MQNTLLSELESFETALAEYKQGMLDFEEFRKIRVWQGVYTFRGTKDQYMIRIKVPQGRVNPEQLRRLSDLVRKYSIEGKIHITTRQDFELTTVPQSDLMAVLRSLAEVNLTTRATGGNGVRNVTACPYSGIAPDELFDVTSCAKAVNDYFIRHPITKHLPRKVKIAFEGCRQDHIRAMIHDIGAFGMIRNNVRGFELYVGGGLGGAPRAADLLEEFTPADQLLATIESILVVFDAHGGRQSKDRARLKFLLKDWGIERFRSAVFEARENILKEDRSWPSLERMEEVPVGKRLVPFELIKETGSSFERWVKFNTYIQRQEEYRAVFIRCSMGDVFADQLLAVADIAQRYSQGFIRTTITQNFLLRWVPLDLLDALHRELKPLGLALCCAEHVMDITRCAGADSCVSAITFSRGLTEQLEKLFSNGLSGDPEVMNLVVKVSGCPHACSQHTIANLGFYGASKSVNGRQVPHYQILVGGSTDRGNARFAKPVALVPAKNVPMATERLIKYFVEHKENGESFVAFSERIGLPILREELKEVTTVRSYEKDPDIYKDWGSTLDYKVLASKGECSA